ncbi:hypothetical protein BDCR2A_01146 [Borrelia duttonii CR2A]|uniref:Uncharacterized protein n=1 Tax=Borrelia duttonii CR2A TaxID=1432657 RepID=W6TXS3_9SPIR|nr:hypothetical protein [Borrelia duttonii]ETZ17951.1 hypothetical protein BDCR2A_01146 [Borrelia duttonii CR2A]
MKNFSMTLVCVLCLLLILFIMFGWDSGVKYHSEFQRELERSGIRPLNPGEIKDSSIEDKISKYERSTVQDNSDETLDDENLLSEVPDSHKTREQAYDELENKVREFKNEFLDRSLRFASGKHQFSMPFFERFAKFDGDDKKDIVYSSLGYDVDVIRKLETLINKVDPNVPSYLSRLDKGIASGLLDVLYNVTYYVREVVINNHLNLFNLGNIKTSSLITADDIASINVLIDTLMHLRRNLTLKLGRYIVLAESKTDKLEMEAVLRKIIKQNGDIRRLIAKIMFISQSIGNLVNVQTNP